MPLELLTIDTHTHGNTHTLPYQCTPEDFMVFGSNPSYYGHPQSAFSGMIEGNESAPSIIQKIHRDPQQGNEMDPPSDTATTTTTATTIFYVSIGHFAHSLLFPPYIWGLRLLSVYEIGICR